MKKNKMHFEVIKEVELNVYGSYEKIEIPEGATHVMIGDVDVVIGYYEEVSDLIAKIAFGRYVEDKKKQERNR